MNSGPGYAKHPNHRITLEPSNGKCEVTLNGQLLASSTQCLVMREGEYPPVIYFPLAALPQERLVASPTETYCPFKGTAKYWHLQAHNGTAQVDDLIWGYPNPYDEMLKIAGYVAFYEAKVDSITSS